ncbi:MAG: hypothetical protein EKK55_01825 [Rhodocyclaceae bacterium]|nr:MAG: hypothetical protein EKK55_01825 [Rhodocyclaceae bacterium]
MSESHRTRLNRETYASLVAAYRVTPGHHGAAGRAAGVDPRTARKAWEQGLSYEWGQTPIRDLIAREQAQARSLLASETTAAPPSPGPGPAPAGPGPSAATVPRAAPPAASPSQVVADAAETRKQEAQLARMTRGKALMLAGIGTVLLVKGSKLAERLNRAIEQRFFAVGPDGKEVPLSLEEIETGFRLLDKLASLSKSAAGVGLTSMEMEQELLGRAPASAAESMTREQAMAECKEAADVYKRAADRAAARGLRLVQGGGEGAAPPAAKAAGEKV